MGGSGWIGDAGQAKGEFLGVVGRSENTAILRVLIVESAGRDGQRLLDAIQGGTASMEGCLAADPDMLSSRLQTGRWDAFVLSCTMPELPAVEAMALFREQAPAVPVILSIERGAMDFPFELLENGACDFVFKSNPSRLPAVIERECAKSSLLRTGREDVAGTIDALPLGEGIARFQQLSSNLPECYWLANPETQAITFISAGYEHIWGRHVDALYADHRDWLTYVHDEDRERVADAMNVHRQGGLDIRFRVLRPGDGLRWLHARNFPVPNEGGEVLSVGGVATDITGQLASKLNLSYYTHFDALTALPNQWMFYDQVQRMIALSKRSGLPLSVMVVDVDRFHEVNQALGYSAGNELLRQMAGRLSGSLRESDYLCRLEGDVFGILLPELVDSQQAGVVARRIIETLIMPVRVAGQDVFATASIGIGFYPQDGQEVHELLSNAQLAGVHAKQQGRNSYQAYSSDMQDQVRERMFFEIDLRNATLCEEFVLHFQPKVSCADGRITGVEALLRWQHPRRGIVSPDQFIPLLEETGLIVQVGRWVLEEACRHAVEWQRAGLSMPSVSVNLSARQLQSETLLADVATTLEETGLPPACLDLEITESMLMHNADTAIRTLSALKKMGVTISLDDFGTGYSSLAYLKRFPLDAVKVDRSFVQDIAADSDDASITRAVITMAHHLKLKVVAEGVETPEQLALLISHQCDVIQGYFFSRPLPADEMTGLLLADQRLPSNHLNTGSRKPMALFVAVSGFDEVISWLGREGHRVCVVPDLAGATQWLSGNLVDVLVCGAPRKGFDSAALIRLASELQPRCERILLADSRQWSRKSVAELSGSGLVHRVIHLPVEPDAFCRVVDDALNRRHISEEYSRLSHEVEVVERQLLQAEEDRRRLSDENRALQAQERQGYLILQEVLSALPIPVIGVDAGGLVALLNEAAIRRFAGRGIAPGVELAAIIPELGESRSGSHVVIDGISYDCSSQQMGASSRAEGRLFLLNETAGEA